MGSARQKRLLDAGDRAPDFTLARLTGGQVTRHEVGRQGPAVLAFFKVTCPVCQYTLPFLERLHQAGKLPIYGVSQDDAKSTEEFNQRFGVTFPVLLDTEESGYPLSNGFGIDFVPSAFLIEPDGRISWTMEGFSRKDLEELGKRAGARPFHSGERVPESKPG